MEKILARKSIRILVLTCLALPLKAEAITWADVKSAALLAAPSLRAAKSKVDAADAGVDSARGDFLPQVSSSLSATRSVNTADQDFSNSYVAGLNVEQSLFSFGKDKAQLNAARANRDAVKADLISTSVTLRAKLAKAWTEALYLRELVKITERNIARREANDQIVKLRYSGGRENKGAVLKTETATLKSKTDSLEAKANFELSKGELSLLIGREVNASEDLQGSILPGRLPQPLKVEPKAPSIVASESKLRAAEETLRAAKSRYLPELSFSASAKKSASPDLPLKNPLYSANISLIVPLFNAATSANLKSAAAETSAAAISLAEARATQKQKIKATTSALNFAGQRRDIALKNFEASKLQAEVSRQRYTLGLMSFQDWDSYENELIKAELDVLSSERDVAHALADYHEATGVTLEEEP